MLAKTVPSKLDTNSLDVPNATLHRNEFIKSSVDFVFFSAKAA